MTTKSKNDLEQEIKTKPIKAFVYTLLFSFLMGLLAFIMYIVFTKNELPSGDGTKVWINFLEIGLSFLMHFSVIGAILFYPIFWVFDNFFKHNKNK